MNQIEKEFDYNDYHCVIIFDEIGYYEGYIALKETDALYEKKLYDINDARVLTTKVFSAGRSMPRNDGNYWLGFLFDDKGTKPDTEKVKQIWGDKAMVLTFLNMQRLSPIPKTGTIRTVEYIEDRLQRLVNEVKDENRRKNT